MEFDIISKKEYFKLKKILKSKLPYVLYKQLFDIYEKDKEELLINTFFSYLCYLSKEEFNSLKKEIENYLNKKINFTYYPIPLFVKEKNNTKQKYTIVKPKIEYEILEKNEIIKLIQEQEKKERKKEKEINV